MQNRPTPQVDDAFSRRLWPFFLLAFGISWGIFGLIASFPDAVERLTGEISAANPLFIIMVYGPAIAALLLVAPAAGLAGLRAFLARLLIFAIPGRWFLVILLALPALFYIGAAIKGAPLVPDGLPGFPAILGAMALMAVLGPVEEIGWRGFALPLLQRRLSPLAASLVLGLIWGIWHLPAFFLSGTPQSNWGFLPFLIGATALSVIATGLFNATRGSLFWVALMHYQLILPLWPDAQPWDTPLTVLLALGLLWMFRADYSRERAVTKIFRPA
jgi:membrane protease YdiL (CAAX protease family)